MIKSPHTALICNECVALCVDIIERAEKMKAAAGDAGDAKPDSLVWSGNDAMGWTARSLETYLGYEVKRSKARGDKWNVVVYEDGADGQKLNRDPIAGSAEAKAKAEADFAERCEQARA